MDTKFELRQYQKDCVNAVFEDWKKDNDKVGIILPTGAGKTEIFIDITFRYLNRHPNECVLILSHLDILTVQTTARFQLRKPSLSVGILQAQNYPDPENRVIVSTMQSARDAGKIAEFLGNTQYKVGLIIVDETHYIEANSYETIIGYFPDARLLGVTATPFRDAQVMLNYFDSVAYHISINDLISQGYLVPPELKNIIMAPDAEAETRMAHVLKIYQESEAGKSALVFMKTIEDAKTMRNVFEEAGISSRAVTSLLTGAPRSAVIDDFRSGRLKVLTTVNVLSHGFDAPIVESIFMPYVTHSPTLYLQRVGRGLRPYPGKESCRVYCMGSEPEIKDGFYQKLNDLVLNRGNKKNGSDCYDFREYLELIGHTKSDEYLWTKKLCKVADAMARLNMKTLQDLVARQDLPARFLYNIDLFLDKLKEAKAISYEDGVSLTDKQRVILKQNMFKDKHLDIMTKREASKLIGGVFNLQDALSAKGLLPKGKFMGRRVEEVPIFYRNFMLSSHPMSPISRVIRQHYGG